MNTRPHKFSRLLFILALIFGGSLPFFWHWRMAENSTNAPKAIQTGSAISNSFDLPPIQPQPADRDQRKLAALTVAMQTARDIGLNMNAPMQFYGRVIDQSGKPVTGIQATIAYVYYSNVVHAFYEPDKSEVKRATDSNGEFSFTGQQGTSLFVTLTPQIGYRYFEEGKWGHSFDSDKASGVTIQPTTKTNPHIFRVYKLGQPADVQEGMAVDYLVPDKRTYYFSFGSKKLSPQGPGDIQVTVWQVSDGLQNDASSWGIELSGQGLELQATSDPFLFWAPTAGYSPSWSFAWSKQDKDYTDTRKFYFWFKRGDYYGAIKIESTAFFKKTEFELDVYSVINKKPNDPNLQPVMPDWPPKAAK